MPKSEKEQSPLSQNDVVLVGRVAAPASFRELPSGDTVVNARLIVDRDGAAMSWSAQRFDVIDCVAWSARSQRSMRAWKADDRVRVEGSIRRRFFRSQVGSSSRVEVEVKKTARVRDGTKS